MVHPGKLRKAQALERKSNADKKLQDGPISLIIMYIFDIVGDIGTLLFNMSTGFRISGSKFVYDMVYKDGSKLIPSAEKFGIMVSLKPLRIILAILYPPLGVFLAKGLRGILYTLIAMVLTYFNVLIGICFALVVIHIPNYGDRFAKYDYYRILTIKQLVTNCKNVVFNEKEEYIPLILFTTFVISFITILYLTMKFL